MRYELESLPYRTNLAQTSYYNPSTTYPTVDTAFPKVFNEEFKEAVDSAQDLHIWTRPDCYWTNELFEDVMNHELEETTEDSGDHRRRPYEKFPPIC